MFTSNEDNRLNSNTFNGWASVASICAHISRVFRNFPVCCTIPLNWFYVGYIVCSQLISTFTKVQYLISIILYYYFHLFSLIQEWIFFYLAVMLFFFFFFLDIFNTLRQLAVSNSSFSCWNILLSENRTVLRVVSRNCSEEKDSVVEFYKT